jgi:N6-adenosine-specific RNA methylase IME4
MSHFFNELSTIPAGVVETVQRAGDQGLEAALDPKPNLDPAEETSRRGADVGELRATPEQLPFHPLADIFPLLDGVEFDGLVSDIKQHGLHEPIVLFEDQILDGRNRYRACIAAGAALHFETYGGGDPVPYVLSRNVRRRHLDASQRALAAAKLATITHGGDRKSNQDANLRVDRSDAAKMLNVSPRSVNSAAKVLGQGAFELVHAVEQGKISASAAASATKLTPERQREAAEMAMSGNVKAARAIINESVREAPDADLGKSRIEYQVILVDLSVDSCSREPGSRRAADNPCQRGDLKIIKERVASVAATDCTAFFWTTVSKLAQALEVMKVCGFEYRSHCIWARAEFEADAWFCVSHELLLVGVRGNVAPPEPKAQWPSVITAPVGEQSGRLEMCLDLIGHYFPMSPMIDLNPREPPRAHWDSRPNIIVAPEESLAAPKMSE